MTTNCCVSCLSDITDEMTSVSCLQGHSICVQNGCLSQWIKLNTLESVNISDAINKVDITRLMLNEGRIICPGCILEYNKVNQTKAKLEHILDRHELMKVLPREDSERIFITLKYIATQSEICKATEQKMERVCQKIDPTLNNLNHDDLIELQKRRAELKAVYPSARQCPSCAFGPLVNENCSDMQAHTNTHNNNCPRCGYFNKDWGTYKLWDGRLPEETAVNTEEEEEEEETKNEEQKNGEKMVDGLIHYKISQRISSKTNGILINDVVSVVDADEVVVRKCPCGSEVHLLTEIPQPIPVQPVQPGISATGLNSSGRYLDASAWSDDEEEYRPMNGSAWDEQPVHIDPMTGLYTQAGAAGGYIPRPAPGPDLDLGGFGVARRRTPPRNTRQCAWCSSRAEQTLWNCSSCHQDSCATCQTTYETQRNRNKPKKIKKSKPELAVVKSIDISSQTAEVIVPSTHKTEVVSITRLVPLTEADFQTTRWFQFQTNKNITGWFKFGPSFDLKKELEYLPVENIVSSRCGGFNEHMHTEAEIEISNDSNTIKKLNSSNNFMTTLIDWPIDSTNGNDIVSWDITLDALSSGNQNIFIGLTECDAYNDTLRGRRYIGQNGMPGSSKFAYAVYFTGSSTQLYYRDDVSPGGSHKVYGGRATTGDTITVTINFVEDNLSFSINGADQGVAKQGGLIGRVWYPGVSLYSVNDAVTFNTDIKTMDQSVTTKGSQKNKAALSGIERSSPFATQRTHAFDMKETDAKETDAAAVKIISTKKSTKSIQDEARKIIPVILNNKKKHATNEVASTSTFRVIQNDCVLYKLPNLNSEIVLENPKIGSLFTLLNIVENNINNVETLTASYQEKLFCRALRHPGEWRDASMSNYCKIIPDNDPDNETKESNKNGYKCCSHFSVDDVYHESIIMKPHWSCCGSTEKCSIHKRQIELPEKCSRCKKVTQWVASSSVSSSVSTSTDIQCSSCSYKLPGSSTSSQREYVMKGTQLCQPLPKLQGPRTSGITEIKTLEQSIRQSLYKNRTHNKNKQNKTATLILLNDAKQSMHKNQSEGRIQRFANIRNRKWLDPNTMTIVDSRGRCCSIHEEKVYVKIMLKKEEPARLQKGRSTRSRYGAPAPVAAQTQFTFATSAVNAKFPNNLQAKSFNSSQIQHGAPGTFQFTEYPKDRLLLDSNCETYDKDTFCTNYKIIYQDNENGITECLCLGHDFEETKNEESKCESKCETKDETEDESLYEHVKDDSLLGFQFMRQSSNMTTNFGILDSFDNGTYKIKKHKHKNTGDTKYIVKKYGNSIRIEVSKDQMDQQEDDVLDNTMSTSNKSMKRKTQMISRNTDSDDHNIATSEFDSEDDGSDNNSSEEIILPSEFAIGSKWIIHGLVSQEGQKLNGHICTVENCAENTRAYATGIHRDAIKVTIDSSITGNGNPNKAIRIRPANFKRINSSSCSSTSSSTSSLSKTTQSSRKQNKCIQGILLGKPSKTTEDIEKEKSQEEKNIKEVNETKAKQFWLPRTWKQFHLQASKILGKNVGYAIQAKNKLTPEINLHSGLRLTESSYEDNVIQILTGDVIVCTRPANDIQQEKTDLLLKIKTDKLEKEKHRLKERKMRSKEAAKKSLITIKKQKEDQQIKDKKLLEENKETTGKKFDFSMTAQAYLDSKDNNTHTFDASRRGFVKSLTTIKKKKEDQQKRDKKFLDDMPKTAITFGTSTPNTVKKEPTPFGFGVPVSTNSEGVFHGFQIKKEYQDPLQDQNGNSSFGTPLQRGITSGTYSPGSKWIIHGLKEEVHLNGKIATILASNSDTAQTLACSVEGEGFKFTKEQICIKNLRKEVAETGQDEIVFDDDL